MAKKDNKKDNDRTSGNKVASFAKDERFKLTFGIFTIFCAIFLCLAFISYFFTWKADQNFEWGNILSGADVTVENWSGKTGARMANLFFNNWFGIASFAFPFLLIIIGLRFLNVRLLPLRKTLRNTIVGAILLSITLGYIFGNGGGFLGSGPGGGHGYFMSNWLNALLGKTGTFFLIVTLIFAFIVFTVKSSLEFFKALFRRIFYHKQKAASAEKENIITDTEKITDIRPKVNIATDSDVELTIEDSIEKEIVEPHNQDIIPEIELETEDLEEEGPESKEEFELGPYDPTLDLSSYKFPGLELLEEHKSANSEVSNEELISNKNKIVETLANYKIQIDKIKATIGPTVTLYEIVPAPGVRISKIKNLEDDIALSLSALGIRIIAPIPGKGTIGIEVPNLQPEIVSMRSVIASRKFQETKYELPIALGKTISNETYVVDLVKMPHLLVAGATGQGKSVGLNAIITSLLYRKHPSQLKFVLVDPKKVELTVYAKLEKHFLAQLPDTEEAIITDTQKVINTLQSLTVEMDQRYNLLKSAHVRNILEYNTKFTSRRLNPENGHRFLPYIVVIIDEFADLIMTAGKEVETPIARLAQLARAIGIHLIIATQRPTTNIITGVIKANFPARIAFRVSSMVDSRTIIDAPGANQLIGRGDMLISGADLIRVQCAFIDIPEIDRITDFISSQRGYPSAWQLPECVNQNDNEMGEIDLKKRDDLFDEAARLIVIHQQGSTSLIQRKFSIGYNRAGRIMDQLEAAGIVGPSEGSKVRQVMYVDEVSLEQLLKRLG